MPRPRKGAHIYRRKGRPGWWAYLDRDHKDIPLGDVDEAEAQLKLAGLLERHLARGVPREPADAGALAKLYVEAERRADVENTPKTAYELQLNLRRIARWCLSQRLAHATEITAQVVADYREWRRSSVGERTKQKVSAARVNRELDAWKRAMKIAIERKVVGAHVLGFFGHLREAKPAPHLRSLTRAEIDAFFAAVPAGPLHAFLRTTLGTAIRDEEARHFDASNLNELQRKVVITPKPAGSCPCHPDGWKTKGFRYREIPVTPATLKAAKALVKAREGGWAIPCERWVWEQIHRACARTAEAHEKAKAAKKRKIPPAVAPFSLHDLRHAGASHWLADGVDIATISRWLGHADVATTQRYLHVVVDEEQSRRKLTW